MVAVFPAALDPNDASTVVSHPGITYGGLVHDGSLGGAACLAALERLANFYASLGRRRLIYKAVPQMYHRVPAQDDLYALFRLGAQLFRRDLSCCLDLSISREPTERRRRGLKRAQRDGVVTVFGNDHLAEFWPVLSATLAARHARTPVHSLAEMRLLIARFPAEIELVCATLEDRVIAGSLLFKSPRVCHIQYTAASEEGRRACASDLLVDAAVERAVQEGCRYFDFGISTEQGGSVLNQGLHTFKAEFGGGGVCYDFYQLSLC
jgi:hypothetical protein